MAAGGRCPFPGEAAGLGAGICAPAGAAPRPAHHPSAESERPGNAEKNRIVGQELG